MKQRKNKLLSFIQNIKLSETLIFYWPDSGINDFFCCWFWMVTEVGSMLFVSWLLLSV